MKYTEFVNAVQGASNTERAVTLRVLNAYRDVVAAALRRGDSVQVRAFGIYYVGKRTARFQRNPRTGARIRVPARKIAKMRMSSQITNLIN